jgi:DNA polymerase-3 subunit beta
MKFSAPREAILKPLQAVIGVVERRQTMPILSNVLLVVRDGVLSFTATDLEVELVAEGAVEAAAPGETTVPGRKLHDLVRALPEAAGVEVALSGERLTLKAGRSRFTLSTLAPGDFPTIEDIAAQQTLEVPAADMQALLEKTHFSMAQQDVRYYLNGMLLEAEGKTLRGVATDGHRLALAEVPMEKAASHGEQVIVPRKGALELNRLLSGTGTVALTLGTNHMRALSGPLSLRTPRVFGRVSLRLPN